MLWFAVPGFIVWMVGGLFAWAEITDRYPMGSYNKWHRWLYCMIMSGPVIWVVMVFIYYDIGNPLKEYECPYCRYMLYDMREPQPKYREMKCSNCEWQEEIYVGKASMLWERSIWE